MPQSDLSRVTEEKQAKKQGGFDDIADVKTNVKPRGGDRLLRFKISNKNKAAAKIADTSTPAVLHRLPFVASKCEP